MEQIISRCGNLCSECPWSIHMRKKISREDWNEYSEQVKKYVGFKPIKYEWEGCVGCLTPDNELPSHPFFNFLKKCRTRKCGSYNEIDNCGYCGRFPCANTVARNGLLRENISERLGKEINDNEYERYIRMFDAMTNLKKIHQEIPKNQIRNPRLISFQPEISELPDKFKNENFKFTYEKIIEIAKSNFGVKGIDTVAGFELFKLRRDFLWRFLWIIGLHGEIIKRELRIDSNTLYENRKPITLPTNEEAWKLYFDILSEFGINAELEIKTDELYTPGGYMRTRMPKTNNPTYIITLKVSSDLQKSQFFKTLKEILSELQKKTGKRAYSNFKKLNLNTILV